MNLRLKKLLQLKKRLIELRMKKNLTTLKLHDEKKYAHCKCLSYRNIF